MQIVYVCITCQDHNKQYLGTQGFEWANSQLDDSLTDAMEHVKEGHYVRTEIRSYEGEE